MSFPIKNGDFPISYVSHYQWIEFWPERRHHNSTAGFLGLNPGAVGRQEGGLNNSFLARVAAVLAVLSLIGAAYDTWQRTDDEIRS